MVLVSHSNRFVFLKTRKTAGTSVEMALEPFCRPPGAVVTEETPVRVTREGIVGRRLQPPSKWRALTFQRDWHNHMPASDVRDGLGPVRWDAYRKLTTVRNPFALAVSRFYWNLSRRGTPEPESFDETRERFKAMLRQRPVDGDYAVVHLDGRFVADHAIRYEHLQDDLAAVLAMIAPTAQPPVLPHTKNTSSRRIRPVPDYFDAEGVELVLRSARWVFDRFGYPERPDG